jgi:type II secretory pathway pseudopilin PulG
VTSRTSTPTHRKQRWTRRGLSLVEVVMASMLLAITASAVVGGITTVAAADAHNQQKLEALELANRLLLQYLDDKSAMPDESAHAVQGRGTYRWAMHTSAVELSTPAESIVIKPTDGPGSKTIDKLVLLSVSVHAGIPDGMGGYASGERLCTLTRVYHPLSTVYRNPDALSRLLRDPGTFLPYVEGLIQERAPAPASPRTSPNTFTGARGPDTSHK